MIELEKIYNPKQVEDKWYRFWLENNLFKAEVDKDKKPFTIVIPPPNVTGVLHMGHALNNTIQDILIRWKKLQGFNVLWVPGTDHAGIATQNVVEKKLAKQDITKEDIGREKFLEHIWEWKKDHGSTIINQLKRLGCACDWSRERFTMDEGLSASVNEAFFSLYNKGLIYKGNYIINWCPRCKTALSDEEAEHREKNGSLYYIRYPIKGENNYIIVATTRPETMLGDVAVAINPKDKRLKDLEGKTLILPIINKEIPIIKDDHVDPEFGTGLVKVTPAHDPNDFEIGKRHKLEPINVMSDDASMINAGKYDKMDRFDCRKVILEDLKKLELIEKIEEHANSIGHCYRCDTIVEPRLSKQWFVKMKPLAEEAIKVVKEKQIVFHPERWEKTYLNWMENIRDWCISRQVWWGHQIPVWYCKYCNEVIVAKTTPQECPSCENNELEQDKDVLDTWFSSWLWPISTLGWPKDTEDLKYFYPTDVLVTAPEIIFFWVARMIVAGLEFKKAIPFSNVCIHGTVRDDTGTKMSKSLGNTIDPLEIIEQFSADSLRFSIIVITSQGQDVYLSPEKFEIGRNFSNKIWNSARFILMKIKENEVFEETIDTSNLSVLDKWIISRLNRTIEKVTFALESFRLNEAARFIYDFIWHDYCDWYIEMSKSYAEDKNVRHILIYVLDNFLKLLHPIMPFLTEELWNKLPIKRQTQSIMLTDWPKSNKDLIDDEIEKKFNLMQNVIQAVRNTRRELNIPYSSLLDIIINCKNEEIKKYLEGNEDIIKSLAKTAEVVTEVNIEKPKNSRTIVTEDFELFIKLEGIIDIEEEKKRLEKNIEKVDIDIKKVRNKLSNMDFIKKAKPEVVEKEKEKEKSFLEIKSKLKEQYESLKN